MVKIKELIRKAKQGDKDAFASLMDGQRLMLYNTALLILKNEDDALDAIQDTILGCWENLPLLKHDNYFKTWLTRILLNKCTDILRLRSRWSPAESAPEQGEESDLDTPMDVRRALEALSCDDRTLLSLFYYDDLSIREIAGALSISEGAVRTRLNRSRNRFKSIYCRKEGKSI